MAIATKRSLAVRLSRLKGFSAPNVAHEQYATDSDVAATMLWCAQLHGDIDGKRIIDLGAGTGILGIGALLLAAQHVTFVERDPRAVAELAENLATIEDTHRRTTIVTGDIHEHRERADVVIENPPFGTRDPGADTAFLAHACMLAPVVYTLHKHSTATHIRSIATRCDMRVTHEERLAFPLPRTQKHHTRDRHTIEVVFFRLARQT